MKPYGAGGIDLRSAFGGSSVLPSMGSRLSESNSARRVEPRGFSSLPPNVPDTRQPLDQTTEGAI